MTLAGHSSLLAIFGWLIAGGLGVPLPEDAALLAAGALIAADSVSLPVALAVAFAGVLGGDLVLFLVARRLGPSVLERTWLRRLLPPARRARIERLYERHGGRLVFIARHVAGLRAAAFVMAGLQRMRVRTFCAWDALAACISVPLVIGLGYAGAQHLDRVRRDLAWTERTVLAVLVLAALVAVSIWTYASKRNTRARSTHPAA